MSQSLTTRPNLDHLRGQAKALLAELRAGEKSAAKAFIDHLPKARGLSATQARAAGFRLSDAQSVVARRSGFASWPALARHVEQLRALEGEWRFESLQVDGSSVPRAMIDASKLLIDGDRFRMDSPEATYDGRFTIDLSHTPSWIDIRFVEGPEAGNSSYGIFELDGDRLTLCLGVVGASRPISFATSEGSGHALEHLRRESTQRPSGVTGGVATENPPTSSATSIAADRANFDTLASPMLKRLEGTWSAVRLVMNDEEMRADWLPFGSRTGSGNESKVVFGGQVMLHVKMRIDDSTAPIAVDYLHLRGAEKGKVSLGIMEWVGEEVRFLIAAPGQPRPTTFSPVGKGQIFSQWKRKDPQK